MFGRLRPSSSSPDSLERPPSKIFKDDPLSIYEATLIKLKLGSQRDSSTLSMEAVEMESDCITSTLSSSSTLLASMEPTYTSINASESPPNLLFSSDEEAMVIDTGSSATSIPSSVGACQSTGYSKLEQSKNASLFYLFSKYNSSRRTLNSSGESMTVASHGSATTSPSSSSCLSLGCTKQQSEHDCHSSSSFV